MGGVVAGELRLREPLQLHDDLGEPVASRHRHGGLGGGVSGCLRRGPGVVGLLLRGRSIGACGVRGCLGGRQVGLGLGDGRLVALSGGLRQRGRGLRGVGRGLRLGRLSGGGLRLRLRPTGIALGDLRLTHGRGGRVGCTVVGRARSRNQSHRQQDRRQSPDSSLSWSRHCLPFHTW